MVLSHSGNPRYKYNRVSIHEDILYSNTALFYPHNTIQYNTSILPIVIFMWNNHLTLKCLYGNTVFCFTHSLTSLVPQVKFIHTWNVRTSVVSIRRKSFRYSGPGWWTEPQGKKILEANVTQTLHKYLNEKKSIIIK